MADFNSNTPTARGMEWQPLSSRSHVAQARGSGIALRFKATAVTLSSIHAYLAEVVGEHPGLGVEVLSTLTPELTTTKYFPGTDTGATFTGWEDAGGATASFADVDDEADVTDYLRISSNVSRNDRRFLRFRGGSAAGTVTGRVVNVAVAGNFKLSEDESNDRKVDVGGAVTLNGTTYKGKNRKRIERDGHWHRVTLADWPYYPDPDIAERPWLAAEADDIVDVADADTMDVFLEGKAVDQKFRVSGYWTEITTCAENRVGYYYDFGQPLAGWNALTLSATSVLTAGAYYYLHIFPTLGNTNNYWRFNVLRHPAVVQATAVGASTGEHRTVYKTDLTGGGAVTAASEVVGEQFAVLLDSSGTVHAQSNPFAQLDTLTFDSSGVANRGCQITDASAVSYAAVRLPVGWANEARRPDRPLVIEVRSGAAISGGGVLEATATLDPATMTSGTVQNVQVMFGAAFTSAGGSTQYHLIVKSAATPGKGWIVPRLDTRSDDIEAGTTTADIQGASQGGTTDSYIEGGTADDRYDLPITLMQAPTAPSGFTATFATADDNHPARVELAWSASSITTAFGGYNLWRRPARAQGVAWEQIGAITVPTGYTAATVEAQHVRFVDEEPGGSVTGGEWEAGWDYAVTLVNAVTGLESNIDSATDTANVVTAPRATWLTCNAARYLSQRLARAHMFSGPEEQGTEFFIPMGRDFGITRTRRERSPRVVSLDWRPDSTNGEAAVRLARAAARAGKQLCLTTRRGDRVLGSLQRITPDQSAASPVVDVSGSFVETSAASAVADYNLPAAVVMDGSADYVTVADHTELDPASSAFSVVYMGELAGSAGSKFAMSKGAVGVSDGFGLSTTGSANQFQWFIDGATTSGGPVMTSAALFSGNWCFVGTTSGTAQSLYATKDDGTTATTATASITHGAVANAVALAIGANNAGASGHMATVFRAFALYMRALTAAEAAAAQGYLLGHPGYRMPYGPILFFDLRDDRSWNGVDTVVRNLANSRHAGTLVSAPPTRGIPQPLHLVG